MAKFNSLTLGISLNGRGFLVLLIPYLTASSWYYLIDAQILSQSTLSGQIFYFSTVLSIFVCSFFVKKIYELHLLYLWAASMSAGMILLFFSASDLATNPLFLSFLGANFGMVMLAYAVYFYKLTTIQERGRVSGGIVLTFLLVYPIIALISGYINTFTSMGVSIISFLLVLSMFSVKLLKPKEITKLSIKQNSNKEQSYDHKTFFLYFISWLIFCFINGVMTFSRYNLEATSERYLLKYLSACFSASLGGWLGDNKGRKVPLSIGLISLGISAAISGLSREASISNLVSITTGLSWGIFLSIFLLTVWGDLSTPKDCVVFYAVGLIPFFFFKGLGYMFMSIIIQIPPATVALLNALLIFASNIPLLLADETLTEHQEINLRLYKKDFMKLLKKWKTKL